MRQIAVRCFSTSPFLFFSLSINLVVLPCYRVTRAKEKLNYNVVGSRESESGNSGRLSGIKCNMHLQSYTPICFVLVCFTFEYWSILHVYHTV